MRLTVNRVWAMPSRHTFCIGPVSDLVRRVVGDGSGWADPFAGFNSPAEFTNDLNPDAPVTSHVDAVTFAQGITGPLRGVLFDPPYSPRQIAECYQQFGMPTTMADTQNAALYAAVKDALAPKIALNGVAICCGWNTNGFGLARGFQLEEVLIVAHGAAHNDTLVTVERKVQASLPAADGVN